MKREATRPLSPHLGIWKWGPAMLVSTLHRLTGIALAGAGTLGLLWWLTAAATGPEAYATFMDCATGWIGKVFAIGLTWAFFEHLFSGLRHFVLDTGAGYGLETSKQGSIAVLVGAILATALVWFTILWGGI